MKIIILMTALWAVSVSSDDICSSDEGQCSKNINKYTKKENEYFGLVENALAEYTPCNQTACNCHADTITEDLKPFRNGISRDMLRSVEDRGTKYQIIDHQLFRQKNCMFPSRCAGIEHFIRSNLPHLPDMDMIINTRDWPQINRNWGVGGPVFSFSKTHEYADIMYPTWSFWEGGPAISLYPTGLGRWDRHRETISEAANIVPWSAKLNLAFFRGSRTSEERDPLVLLSRAHPDLADASYTKNQAWKSPADTLNAEPAPEISLEDHCKYKFLFNFRGVAASFRFKHLFLCRSLVFHVGDEWLEFFYPSMRPWVHYVPVQANPTSDELQRLIEFFRRNDDLAKEIADRGFEYIWANLDMSQVDCYWRRLLRRYAKLLRFEVVHDHNLIAV